MVEIKQIVKDICNEVQGGRSALAGALGMTTQTFNNKLYEKNGCRFFEVHELEAMEDICGKPLLAEYFAMRSGGSFVKLPEAGDLDKVELFELSVSADTKKAFLSLGVSQALSDGVIDDKEREKILNDLHNFLSSKMKEVMGLLKVYEK